MTLSLYECTVPFYIQGLKSILGLLAKAEDFCKTNDMSEGDMFACRLAEDMFPFAYQVKSTVVHSLKAIDGLGAGSFSPDMAEPPKTFAKANALISDAITKLEAIKPEDLNAYVGKDMMFVLNDYKVPFTAENFLFSFSKPNFYFHASTTYALLRAKGVKVGKRDFLGPMQIKTD